MGTGVPRAGGREAAGWKGAQLAAVLALLVLIVVLFRAADVGLKLFWTGAVPLIPLLLLVQPTWWRNVCPLATLNQWTGRRSKGRTLGTGPLGSGVLTLAAFSLVLPLRPLILDVHGPALAGLLLAFALLAITSGLLVRDRGGFCHLLCPVLPAERLYGVAPVVRANSARCSECSVCTPRGCPELAGPKALPQLLGPRRKTKGWVATANVGRIQSSSP